MPKTRVLPRPPSSEETAVSSAPVADRYDVTRVAELIGRGTVPAEARSALADLLVLADLTAGTPLAVRAAAMDVVNAFRPRLLGLRTVRVQDRQDLAVPRVLAVTVPWTCPTCGGERGEPETIDTTLCGARVQVDYWRNKCGHVDHHHVVVREAARYRELVDVDALAGIGGGR